MKVGTLPSMREIAAQINTAAQQHPDQPLIPQDFIDLSLNTTKESLIKKIENGYKFHSVKMISDPGDELIPSGKPLLARGVCVKSLTDDEKFLAEEVFGVVFQVDLDDQVIRGVESISQQTNSAKEEPSKGQFFLPVDMDYQGTIDHAVDFVALKLRKFSVAPSVSVSESLSDKKYLISFGGKLVGAGAYIQSMISQYGAAQFFGNFVSRITGGQVLTVGLAPVAVGVITGVAAVSAVLAARKIPDIAIKHSINRQNDNDRMDGSEISSAAYAVSKATFESILGNNRSDILPKMDQEMLKEMQKRTPDENVVGIDRVIKSKKYQP